MQRFVWICKLWFWDFFWKGRGVLNIFSSIFRLILYYFAHTILLLRFILKYCVFFLKKVSWYFCDMKKKKHGVFWVYCLVNLGVGLVSNCHTWNLWDNWMRTYGKNRTRGCSNHDKTKEWEMDWPYPKEGERTPEWPWRGTLDKTRKSTNVGTCE